MPAIVLQFDPADGHEDDRAVRQVAYAVKRALDGLAVDVEGTSYAFAYTLPSGDPGDVVGFKVDEVAGRALYVCGAHASDEHRGDVDRHVTRGSIDEPVACSECGCELHESEPVAVAGRG